MKKLIISYMLLCAGVLVSAPATGQVNVDSLIEIVNSAQLPDKEMMATCFKLCVQFNNNDNDRLWQYAQQGVRYARKIGDKSTETRFNLIFGQVCNYRDKPDSAFYYYENALKLSKEAADILVEAGVYLQLGNLYLYKADKAKGLESYFQALRLYEQTEAKSKICGTLSSIATIYKSLNDLDRALMYLEKAKTIANEIQEPMSIITVSYDLASLNRMKKNYDMALEYGNTALETSKQINNKHYRICSDCVISLTYIEKNEDIDNAMKYALDALKTAEEYGYQRDVIASIDAVARVYFYKKDFKKARELSMQAWLMDTLNSESRFNLTYRIMASNAYLGNPDEAMRFFEKHNEMVFQERDREFQEKIAEQEVRYETEKKELRIAALEQEKRLYFMLIALAVFTVIAVVAFLVISRRLARQKIRQLEQEKQLTAAEAVIEGETAERSRLARDLHDGLGGMLAAVKINLSDIEQLQKAREMLDSSIEELRRVAHHLMPASLLRFGMKASLEDFCRAFPNVQFHFFGDDRRISEKIEVLVYRCVYELVNNAVKHSGADTINVQLLLDDTRLALTVQDNGHGFDPTTAKEGMGLENLRTRLAAFGGTMDIASAEGEGTETNIELAIDN
jgi:signal transduction histidine kinase